MGKLFFQKREAVFEKMGKLAQMDRDCQEFLPEKGEH